jgi:hypothetical protein
MSSRPLEWLGGITVRRRVFVIHGRDEAVRERMFDFLRALDLKPLEWETLVAASGSTVPFLGDVVQRAPALARAAVVLLTPDDVVNLHPGLQDRGEAAFEIAGACQPRPNVLIELGMVLMAYPQRAIIVEFGSLRPVADLAGRNVIRFDGSAICLGNLAERLKSAGCTADTKGSDWRNPRRFQGLDAYDRRPSAAPPNRPGLTAGPCARPSRWHPVTLPGCAPPTRPPERGYGPQAWS